MTNEEKDLLIAYLVDAGDIDPGGDVEAQFLEWCQVREQVVSGEVHYKAILDAARVRQRSFDRGTRLADVVRQICLATAGGCVTTTHPAAATPRGMRLAGWSATRRCRWISPGCDGSWTTCTGRRKKREGSSSLNFNMVNSRQRSSPWRHISTMTVPR